MNSRAGLTDASLDLQAALAAGRMGTWHWDARRGVVQWDATLQQLAGLTPGEFDATFEGFVRSLHPDDVEGVLAVVDDAVARRAPYHFEHRVVWPDGTVRWLECRGEVTTGDLGEMTGTVGCAVDVTDRKEAEARQQSLLLRTERLSNRLALLQRLSVHLASCTTVNDVTSAVRDMEIPVDVRTRGLWLVDERRRALEAVVHEGLLPDALIRFPEVDLDADLPLADVVRHRRTIMAESVDEVITRYPALDGVPLSAPAFAAAPLCIADRCIGALLVGFDEGSLADDDLAFLEAAAGHIAQTLDRVRLSQDAIVRAEEAAGWARRERQQRERLQFLSGLTDLAVASNDHRELMRRATTAAVPKLGDWCSLHFRPEPGGPVEVVVAHVDPDKVAWAEALTAKYPYNADGETGVPAVIRSGRTEFIDFVSPEIIDQALARSPIDAQEARAILEVLDLTSVITVPLTTKRGVIGAMQFVTAESHRRYDQADLALAEAAGGRVADALENMWFSDQHRRISASLQQALLPPVLPDIPGIEVAAHYWPAGAGVEVGGDFYDVFPVDDHRWAVVIGDVCGTGPDAAAVTSIARHTVRAAARHGHPHETVVDWLNEAIGHSDRDLFCTAVYGTLESEGSAWRLRVAFAGHPLAVVVRADGTPSTFGRPGRLLGVFREGKVHPTDTLLQPGDVVVLYTDGITDVPAPHGMTADDMEQLVGRAARAGTASQVADAILAAIAERLPLEWRHDDVAVLVLRVTPQP